MPAELLEDIYDTLKEVDTLMYTIRSTSTSSFHTLSSTYNTATSAPPSAPPSAPTSAPPPRPPRVLRPAETRKAGGRVLEAGRGQQKTPLDKTEGKPSMSFGGGVGRGGCQQVKKIESLDPQKPRTGVASLRTKLPRFIRCVT